MEKNEERKVVIDLRNVTVEKEIDVFVEMDLSKPIGNIIHQQAGDIGLDEKARELYHKGVVEMDVRSANIIRQIIDAANLVFYIHEAVAKKIDDALKD